jgi:hypothetical protein
MLTVSKSSHCALNCHLSNVWVSNGVGTWGDSKQCLNIIVFPFVSSSLDKFCLVATWNSPVITCRYQLVDFIDIEHTSRLFWNFKKKHNTSYLASKISRRAGIEGLSQDVYCFAKFENFLKSVYPIFEINQLILTIKILINILKSAFKSDI